MLYTLVWASLYSYTFYHNSTLARKSSYVLGSEAWEEYSSGLLGLIKDFVLGRLGYIAKTLTFTSLILRMTLGI